MISDTRQSQLDTLPSLLTEGKASEDFLLGFPSGEPLFYDLDGVNADRNAATVKPVANVSFGCDPFEVFDPVIGFNLIFMMNDRKIIWIGDKGQGNEPVYRYGLDRAISRKFHLRISSRSRTSGQYGAALPAFGRNIVLVGVNETIETSDAPHIADLVANKSRDVSPLFSSKNIKKFWFSLREKLSNRSLYIKGSRLSPPFRRAQVRNKVPVVYGCPEHARRQLARERSFAVFSQPRNSTNALMVRDFVNPIVARNGKPDFTGQIRNIVSHCLFPILLMLSKAQEVYRHETLVGQVKEKISKNKEFLSCP